MDVLFAFTGDKFAVVVSDTIAVQQIIVQKDDMEKIMDLDSHKVLGLTGPKGDCCETGHRFPRARARTSCGPAWRTRCGRVRTR
jgi:20S proteasome alpha/beta subunit